MSSSPLSRRLQRAAIAALAVLVAACGGVADTARAGVESIGGCFERETLDPAIDRHVCFDGTVRGGQIDYAGLLAGSSLHVRNQQTGERIDFSVDSASGSLTFELPQSNRGDALRIAGTWDDGSSLEMTFD